MMLMAACASHVLQKHLLTSSQLAVLPISAEPTTEQGREAVILSFRLPKHEVYD